MHPNPKVLLLVLSHHPQVRTLVSLMQVLKFIYLFKELLKFNINFFIIMYVYHFFLFVTLGFNRVQGTSC